MLHDRTSLKAHINLLLHTICSYDFATNFGIQAYIETCVIFQGQGAQRDWPYLGIVL